MKRFNGKRMAVMMMAAAIGLGALYLDEKTGVFTGRHCSAVAEGLFTEEMAPGNEFSTYPETLPHPMVMGLLAAGFLGIALMPKPYRSTRQNARTPASAPHGRKSAQRIPHAAMAMKSTRSLSPARCAENASTSC